MINKLTSKLLPKESQESLIQTKLEWILLHSDPEKIILFGSASSYQMTESSDIDILIIFADKLTLQAAKKSLFENRPVNDWPQDILYHTFESFQSSVDSGGGAAFIAHQEGRILFSKEKIS